MDQNEPRHHWLSFGIRDLLWAMVVLATALAWALNSRELKQELTLLRKSNEFLRQDVLSPPDHPWNLGSPSLAIENEAKSSAVANDASSVASSSVIGEWSIERLDIATERGVMRVADSGTAKITDTLLEISYPEGERQTPRPFEYSLDKQRGSINLTAGEWDGEVIGAGPNRYSGRYELEGDLLKIGFGRFHRPESFTPERLKPAVDEMFVTPGSDTAWFLKLKRAARVAPQPERSERPPQESQ